MRHRKRIESLSLPSGKKKSAFETRDSTITECKCVVLMSVVVEAASIDFSSSLVGGDQIKQGVTDMAMFSEDIVLHFDNLDNLSKKRIKYRRLFR